MAIDYVIDYRCVPKDTLETGGILERLKAQERARAVIELYRRSGDNRPPSEMGFEFTRTAADGSEESQVIIVQHLLDFAADLRPLEPYCAGCPANRAGVPFGCMGRIAYPLSSAGEAWLLNQLPNVDETLLWMLLRQGIKDLDYDGSAALPLREADSAIFADPRTIYRTLGELTVNNNQIFEMVFLVGHIQPNHAGILLLFFGAVTRQLEAQEIMAMGTMPPPQREQVPFQIGPEPGDDSTIAELKEFLYGLYLAWQLDVPLLLDV
jgi:hypothetical protein